MNYNTTGEILQDVKNGKEQPFREKKLNSLKVADSFYRIAEEYKLLGYDKKALRIKLCGSNLTFKVCTNDNYKKLIGADFCRERLCVMCNWRRSKKLHSDIMLVLHKAQERKKLKFMFLTLTLKNCEPDKITETITQLYTSIKQFWRIKEIDKITIGYVQVLEITKNIENNTYHPHFHVMIGVNPSYFLSRDYIKKDAWVEYWKRSLKVDYDPIVDIKVVKPKRDNQTLEAAVAETAKYSVKESDYISDDFEEMDDTVLTLSNALKNRKLISFGRLFKEIKKELNLKDTDAPDADLVNADGVGCDCPICGSTLVETLYNWKMGLNQYLEVNNG